MKILINRNFALLWSGQAISIHNFHALVLGMTFGPVDTLFTASGMLIFIGGVYAMIGLRGIKATVPQINTILVAQETR